MLMPLGIALWDPTVEVKVGTEMLHDNVGYTPYEGRTVTGWPTTVISRGRVVVDDGKVAARWPVVQTGFNRWLQHRLVGATVGAR